MACYCGTNKKVETPKPMLKDPVMLQTIKVDKPDNENLSTTDSLQPNQNCSSRPQRTGSPQHKPTGSPQPQRTGSPQPQLTNQMHIDDTDAGRQIEEIGGKIENVNCSSGNTVTHAENQEKELKELEANDTGEAGHLSTLVLQILCGDVLPATLGRQKRVVSGRTMSLGEWPFLVSLHFLKPFPFTTRTHMQHLCGGALIHPRWVLTAAHCVGFFEELRDVENWRVALGEHNQYLKDLGEQIIRPEQFFIHPDFQPSKTNTLESDIALIKLSEAAFLTPYVGTISLNNHSAVPDNTKCLIGGWGQVASEPYGWGMYIPLKASLYIINNVTCSDVYAGLTYEDGEIYMKVDESVMCAGIPQNHQSQLQRDHGGNSDACNGDSGSPLVCPTGNAGEYEIAGIVSAGKGCGTGKYPGIYTKISYFYPWIAKIMKDN